MKKCSETDAIFSLLRTVLHSGTEDLIIGDPGLLFTQMKEQSVAALPGQWLKDHPLPGTEQWLIFCARQQAQWIRIMHAQEELLNLLEANGIPCVIIKGAAAAMAYPYPALRSMGDVDFLVKRCDYELAAALLEENGYCLAHDKNPAAHHYGYRKDRVSFELHRRLGTVRETDERLLSLFENGIEQREWHDTEGFRFPVLPTALNGLVLIYHINQHLRSGLGLRQIIDWMMYIRRLDENVWQEQVLPMLRETGMERLALTVTAMCRKYLGLEKSVENSEDYPVDDLMDYIMEKGNFGRKAGEEGRIASYTLSVTGIDSFFKRLQEGGLSRWKAAKRFAVLRPFAWIYQVFRIAGVLVKNKISPGTFLRQQRKGMEQKKLMEALGLRAEREIGLKKV